MTAPTTTLTSREKFERPDGVAEPSASPAWRSDAPGDGEFVFARGHAGRPVVLFADEPFERRFRVHSPTGYEWGYGGSGPADLALNILALFLEPWDAWWLHQSFKFAHIGTLNPKGDTLSVARIRSWIERTHREISAARGGEV
jgi:hypothetical protein